MFLILVLAFLVLPVILFIKNRFFSYLFLIPLSVYGQSATLFSIGARPINLGLDTIYIFVILILEFRFNNKENVLLNRPSTRLMVYFIYILFNIVFNALVLNKMSDGLLVFLRLVQYVPIYIMLSNFKIDKQKTYYVIMTFILVGAIASIQAVFQSISGAYPYMKGMPSFTLPIFRSDEDGLNATGLYIGSANYNVFAGYMVISVFLVVFLILARKHTKGVKLEILIPLLLISVVGIYLSSSRAALLAVVVGMIFLCYKLSFKIFIKGSLICAFLIFCLIIAFPENELIVSTVEIFTKFDVALPHVLDNEVWTADMGISGPTLGAVQRLLGYLQAMKIFIQYPIAGCGFSMFLTYSEFYPENMFLQILAETGIIGFGLYLSIIVSLYKSANKMLQKGDAFNEKYVMIYHVVILGMIIVNTTGALFYIQKVWGPFLLLSGFLYGYLRHESNNILINNEADI